MTRGAQGVAFGGSLDAGARVGVLVGAIVAIAGVPTTAGAQVDGQSHFTRVMLERGLAEGAEAGRGRPLVGGAARFGGTWKVTTEDDPRFAAPDFDDRAWPSSPTAFSSEAPPAGWQGRAWFRLHLTVDPELRGRPLALAMVRLGDVEVFLDGRRIFSSLEHGPPKDGDATVEILPAPIPVILDREAHVIAVRYLNPLLEEAREMAMGPGFFLYLGETAPFVRALVALSSEVVGVHAFFMGVMLSFGLLHFLLFFFNRESPENLYFALTTLAIAGITHATMGVAFVKTVHGALAAFLLFKLSVLATVTSTLLSMYAAFSTVAPRRRWIFIGGSLGFAVASPFLRIAPIYVFALVLLAETLRVIIRAVRAKLRGARIVGAGMLVFLAAAALQMLPDLGVGEHWVENIYLYGFVGCLAAMSTHFARELARARREQALQLVQVKELSAITLEQERRAKEDEVARRLLEVDVAQKARALEEAKKLEVALTELEAANKDIRAKQAQLIQSEKMASLGMLVAGVAHEINTPVGAISSMHDTSTRALAKLKKHLEDRLGPAFATDDRLQAFFRALDDANRVVGSGSSRVAGIVQRLRSFARLDEAELKTVDLREGVEDTLLLLHHELKRGITVTKRFGDVPPIACYPSQLNQVLLNLLVNARQAIGDRPGSITIETAVVDGKVHLSIADDGPGIPPEVLPRIFDPGFTTKGAGVGTGLGLAICYQIMQAHKGEIRVESEPGKGAKLTLVLPMDLEG